MRHFLLAFLLVFVVGVAQAQQAGVREVENIAALQLQVQDVSRTRFVKGYLNAGDGASSLFVFTNTALATNLGTRIQVIGKTYSWERVHDGLINIRWFGARGDGVTDDTATIQDAIDYCAANNFTVVIPSGTFSVASSVNLRDNSKIIGTSTTSILFGNATIITVSIASKTNVLLRDFQIAGSSATQLKINTSQNVRVENVSVSGATLNFGSLTAGVQVEGGGNITLDRVHWFGNGIPASTWILDYNMVANFAAAGTTTNLVILNPIVENLASKMGICLFAVNDAQIIGGSINMNNQGTTADNNGYALVCYGYDGTPCLNPTFTGTSITNTYGSAIYIRNVIGGTISEQNIAKAAQVQGDVSLPVGAIVLNIAEGVRVINNGVTNSSPNSGIVICHSTNSTVAENTVVFTGSTRFGIELRGENFGASLKGNAIKNAFHGIGTSVGPGPNKIVGSDIEGNLILDIVDGISLLAGSSNNIVRGNRVYDNTGAGIFDAGSYNTFGFNDVLDGVVGIYAAGTNGLILPNLVQRQTTGLLASGNGYRFDPIGRYHENTIPISDPGGNIIKTITSGTTPSVKDAVVYSLNFGVATTITDFSDGLIGMRRTFIAANSNATIAHNALITLDGAGNFNMKAGDVLSLERDSTGLWRQVGKSINADWQWYDQANLELNINRLIRHNFARYLQTYTPSSTTYAEEHTATNTVPNTLIAHWMLTGSASNTTVMTLKSSSDQTNGVIGFNGVDYIWPRTNGLSELVLATDGGSPQRLYWTNIAGGAAYTFDPTQFTSGGGAVALKNDALTTNLVFKGRPLTPTLNVPGVNIDATIGEEFSKELSSNTAIGITGMTNDQTIHFTVTNSTFTLSFTNTDIHWISTVVPVLDLNAVNVYHFRKQGGRILASDPEQVANANMQALAAMAGTGVLVKTNASTIVAFDPLPVRFGGTGTNSFNSVADGNMIFHNLSQNALDSDDGQFTYSKSSHTLTLARTVPTGSSQLTLFEGSGQVPIMELYPNQIVIGNDNLSVTGSNILFYTGSAAAALKVSIQESTVIGDGTTTTTRTNKFLYLPSTLGPPTGVPHPETGRFPISWDSVNNRLYLYDGGWIIVNTGTANWIASGTTNSLLAGTAFANELTVTDGTFTGTVYVNAANSLSLDSSSGAIYMEDPLLTTHIVPQAAGLNSYNLGSASTFGSFNDLFLVGRLNWNAVTNSVFDSAGNGSPEGVVIASPGSTFRSFNGGSSTTFYVKESGVTNTGWIAYGAGGGGASDNWAALGLVDSTLVGDAYAAKFVGTNGFETGLGLYTAAAASMRNNGGVVTVVNNSTTRLSSVKIKGGTGSENFITFETGGTNRAQFESNGVFQAWFGTRSANSVVTNGLTVLDVQATNIVGLDANQKVAKVNVGAGLTWTPATMTISLSGGGALAGSGTPTYYSQWTGAAALGDGGLYHIDSNAVGLGSTNFFLHTMGSINNLGIGEDALALQPTGAGNLAIGRQAGMNLTSGSDNIIMGYSAMTVAGSSSHNVAIGAHSMAANNGGNSNVFVGWYSGNSISTGDENSGFGIQTLFNSDGPHYNSAFGALAGFDNDNGSFNTYVGAHSGYFDGNGALAYTNTTQIGFGSNATNSNAVVLGNENVTRWQLGNGGPTILKGTGTPEGNDAGNVGDIFIRTDGASGTTMYWKETGAGTLTGWVGKTSTSSEVTRLHIESGKPPQANPARLNPVSDYLWELLFDASTSQSRGYSFIMPQGYGSALKVRFKTTVKTVQTGTKNIVYRFSVAAMKATEDPTNPTFATANSVTVTLGNNQAANAIVESTLNLTNADSVAAGDLVILKVDRNAADGTDDATGDSALVGSLAVEWLKQ